MSLAGIGIFLASSLLYLNAAKTSAGAAKKEYAFIDKNHCVLNNWQKSQDIPTKKIKDPTPKFLLINQKTGLKSKTVLDEKEYTTLKHLKKFVYECNGSVMYESRFGFFDKVSGKLSNKTMSFKF